MSSVGPSPTPKRTRWTCSSVRSRPRTSLAKKSSPPYAACWRRQRTYLGFLFDDQARYFDALLELGAAYGELTRPAESFLRFINERVVWTRNAEPLWWSDAAPAAEALAWLFGPAQWASLPRAVADDAARTSWCSRPPGTGQFWTCVDPKILWWPGHRPAHSFGVCSPSSRCVAPLRPRYTGLSALTTAPRTPAQTGSYRTMPNPDALQVVVDDLSRFRRSEATVDT